MEYVEHIVILLVHYVGDRVKKRLLSKKEDKKLEIIYKSANYIVINKPHDLLINSSNPENKETLEWRLRAELPALANLNRRLKNGFYFVHRLDYAVSGLIVLALNKRACAEAAACFRNRTVSKYYVALVRGHVACQMLDVQVPVGADRDELALSNRMSTEGAQCVAGTMKPAHTRLLVIERGIFAADGYPATKVLLKLISGRRHQLRVHCQHLGHTIVGDYTYSNRRDTLPQRTFLHSFRLVLNDGVEMIDASTVDPFEASRGWAGRNWFEASGGGGGGGRVWRCVEVVNRLDANAFRQLESSSSSSLIIQ